MFLFFVSENPPTRLFIAVMLFLACLVAYMTRVNFSILIVAMVKPTNPNITAPDVGVLIVFRSSWKYDLNKIVLICFFFSVWTPFWLVAARSKPSTGSVFLGLHDYITNGWNPCCCFWGSKFSWRLLDSEWNTHIFYTVLGNVEFLVGDCCTVHHRSYWGLYYFSCNFNMWDSTLKQIFCHDFLHPALASKSESLHFFRVRFGIVLW